MNSNRGWFVALAVAPMFFAAGLAHADEPEFVVQKPHRPFCDALTTPAGMMRCHSHVITNPDGTLAGSGSPQGLGPSELAKAYGIPSTGPGAGLTVGIVDANDDTTAEADLAAYRSHYNLPACTTANGCFKKVGQTGTSTLPSADTGWAGEITLDLDMVSAVCPSCKIVLVEVDSASTDDLGEGLLTAISLGAVAVSNSYGGGESSADIAAESSYFSGHSGVLITVSAGDDGYGAQFPATSPSVLAIGGTLLTASSSSARGYTETVWGGSASNGGTGSGCTSHTQFARPAWQSTLPAACKNRMESDVSANADPNSGVATYCTKGCGMTASAPWEQVGGTSEASPIVASLFTLLGLATRTDLQSYLYANPSMFNDITKGTNVVTTKCSTADAYYCNAEVGYDGPTGLGTPISSALLQGGTTPVVDAGSPTTGQDSGTTPPTGGKDAGSPTSGGDDSGSPSTGGGDDDTDSGSPSTGGDDDDSGSGTGYPVVPPSDDAGTPAQGNDAGNGNGFGGGGGSASNGCSCNAPGTSSPLGEGGASLLALGAVAVFASRRRRRD